MAYNAKYIERCPFCGANAHVWGASPLIKITCEKDCVSMPAGTDVFFTSEEQAIQQWNKRVE